MEQTRRPGQNSGIWEELDEQVTIWASANLRPSRGKSTIQTVFGVDITSQTLPLV